MSNLRQRVSKLKSNGVSYSFIAKKMNISSDMIRKFAKDERNLSAAKEEELEQILDRLENLYY